MKGDSAMTYQGIELTHSYGDNLSGWNKNAIRKTAYNLLTVFALMAATGVVVSAYHPAKDVPNMRLESMGKHVPTTFKGAPPVK